ncbi:hypothetical protein J6590_046625 [Homalodisca vitripennis]|nr:hypothetical protein J6590_046625 [Homalodisca vitripennis]
MKRDSPRQVGRVSRVTGRGYSMSKTSPFALCNSHFFVTFPVSLRGLFVQGLRYCLPVIWGMSWREAHQTSTLLPGRDSCPVRSLPMYSSRAADVTGEAYATVGAKVSGDISCNCTCDSGDKSCQPSTYPAINKLLAEDWALMTFIGPVPTYLGNRAVPSYTILPAWRLGEQEAPDSRSICDKYYILREHNSTAPTTKNVRSTPIDQRVIVVEDRGKAERNTSLLP